jgi:hypothetical protein
MSIRDSVNGHDTAGAEPEQDESFPMQLVEMPGVVVGDMTWFGEYRFLPNRKTPSSAAFLFVVKMPSGRTDFKSNREFF